MTDRQSVIMRVSAVLVCLSVERPDNGNCDASTPATHAYDMHGWLESETMSNQLQL